MKATSKLRPPLSSYDWPLLRVRGRFLSDNADMPTMNMQISSIFYAYYAISRSAQNCALLQGKEYTHFRSCHPALPHIYVMCMSCKGCLYVCMQASCFMSNELYMVIIADVKICDRQSRDRGDSENERRDHGCSFPNLPAGTLWIQSTRWSRAGGLWGWQPWQPCSLGQIDR